MAPDGRIVPTGGAEPSPWITRWAPAIPDGPILDVACGRGRHTRYFLDLGRTVVAVDRDLAGIADVLGHGALTAVAADLEDGSPFPVAGRRFAAVVCTNYLHRPLLPALVAAVAPGGVLVYETFAAGHEKYGPPSNPEYLLRPGELRGAVAGQLIVLADEELVVHRPGPARLQHIAAKRPLKSS